MADLYLSNVPKSSQQTVIVICCVFLTVSWLTLFLRVWVRAGLLRNFGWDDAAMVLTNCVFTCFCVVTVLATSLAASGELRKFSMAKMEQLTTGLITAFTSYVMTMVLFKIALAIFYFRIVVRRWHKWTVYVALAINTAYGLFYVSRATTAYEDGPADDRKFFIVLFRCGNPTQYLQNQLLGQCLSNDSLFGINLTSGIINAATDWALAILPIFVLRQADLPLRTRLAVCFILMLGTVGSIVSVVRLPFIKGLAMGPNFFRNAVDTTIWSVIEPGIGITAACLATLRPLFRCVDDDRTTSRTRSASDPLAPPPPAEIRSDRPASFSTWRTEQMKSAGYEELEMQQRLEERPTFQDRLNHAKAEEESRSSFATARSRNGEASVYSNRSQSVKSGDTRNFSRPTPLPHFVAQLRPPLPTHAACVQRSMSERVPAGLEYQHGRQKSKQTL